MDFLRNLGLLAGVFLLPKYLAGAAVVWVLVRLHPLLQWALMVAVVLGWGNSI